MTEDEILKEAKRIRAERTAAKKQTRINVINGQIEQISKGSITRPSGLFHVISIDPPWPYDLRYGRNRYDPIGRKATSPYPEMPIEQLRHILLPAADDCVLWLWTTHSFIRDAYDLLEQWGFEDKAMLTWVKDRIGLGTWLRSKSEFCILATKGKPVINLTNQSTVLYAPRREHSRKPDEFYKLVDSLCVGRKLDFFSREVREGWAQMGNDTTKFNEGAT